MVKKTICRMGAPLFLASWTMISSPFEIVTPVAMTSAKKRVAWGGMAIFRYWLSLMNHRP